MPNFGVNSAAGRDNDYVDRADIGDIYCDDCGNEGG